MPATSKFLCPRELGKAEAIRLAQDFVREQFVDRGMLADLNVHWTQARDGGEQPHAHVMLTMREVVPGEDGPEGKEEAGFGKKVVAWNDRGLLEEWRKRWAELANARLLELGHDVRIDHRSYAEQGIDLEPQHKIGPAGVRREDREQDAGRAAEHREIGRRNGDKLRDEPEIALRALTQQHSTFTRQKARWKPAPAAAARTMICWTSLTASATADQASKPPRSSAQRSGGHVLPLRLNAEFCMWNVAGGIAANAVSTP